MIQIQSNLQQTFLKVGDDCLVYFYIQMMMHHLVLVIDVDDVFAVVINH